MRFSRGETLQEILDTSDEVVEGINTLKIINQLARRSKISLPITFTLQKVIFEGMDMRNALTYLMSYAYGTDVDIFIQKDKNS